MATYAYTDVLIGFESDGVRPRTIKAGEALVAGKESGLTKEDIDAMVERGVAGEDKHVPVGPNDVVHTAATLEERESGVEAGSVGSERSYAGR